MSHQEGTRENGKHSEWRYYSNAILPCCAPHENPCTEFLENGSAWKMRQYSKALFARWTTDFDCGQETSWWYVLKDIPFDIDSLKSKRRYEINKGNKFFEVRCIDAQSYKNELFDVQVAAFSAYPPKYRPTVEKSSFFQSMDTWKNSMVYGAFFKETGLLCGYAILTRNGERCLSFSVQKTIPAYEKYAVNAALVYKILVDNEPFILSGGYICDGERCINHETAFQEYLEKYFGFRKAYCRLHMHYRPMVSFVVRILYPMRRLLDKFDRIGIVHKINAVLRMETISRGDSLR